MVAEGSAQAGGQARNDSSKKLVCFYLQGQEYAAAIGDVKESLTMRPITRVILTPDWLAGIINLRGDVVAVIDLALLLGMERTHITGDSRIIVARIDGRRMGILCDALADLRTVDLASLEPCPTTLPDACAQYMAGILTVEHSHALRIIDFRKLFESEALAAFRRGDPK